MDGNKKEAYNIVRVRFKTPEYERNEKKIRRENKTTIAHSRKKILPRGINVACPSCWCYCNGLFDNFGSYMKVPSPAGWRYCELTNLLLSAHITEFEE